MVSKSPASLRAHSFAIFFFAAITILMTWPVAARLNTHIAGYAADNYLFVWTTWVFDHEIQADLDPLHTTTIYYPQGANLVLHALVTPKSISGLALHLIASPVATFNLLFLLSMTACGYTAWLLVRHLTHSNAAGLVGGIIYACSPFYLAHATAGHLDYISAEGIPLFIYFFIRSFDQKRRRDAIWAGLAMGYTGLCNWAYLLYLLVFCTLFVLYHLITERRYHLSRINLRQYALAASVAIVSVLPLMIPAARASASGTYNITRYVGGAALYVSDLLGFFVPSPDHFLLGDWVAPVFSRFTGGLFEGTVYVGFSVLILAAIGASRAAGIKNRRLWLLVVGVFALLSMGPGLHVLGQYQFPQLAAMQMGTVAENMGVPMKPEWVTMFNQAPMIPLPGAALQLLPVFKWTRAPSRFMAITMLALAVLAGFGLLRAQTWLTNKNRFGKTMGRALPGLAGLIILAEFCIVPFPTTPADVPAFYHQLATEPGEFAVLDLPIEPYQLQPQYRQTVHGKSLVYGHISRLPEEQFAYLDFIENEIYNPTGYFEVVDIRYLILHTDQPGAEDYASALTQNFELIHSDIKLKVFWAY